MNTAAEGTRINKYLSEIGFCSRREADKLIASGAVKVNGKVPTAGQKLLPGDDLRIKGKKIRAPKRKQHTYIAFNKPRGIVSTTDTKKEKRNIIDYIGHKERIFPIGRLDKDSEGLILLTSDGDIVNKILRNSNAHDKEYFVAVDKPITAEFIKKMQNGVPILDTITKKCKVEQAGNKAFKIILQQGLNRQIRRMCEHLGYEVKKLKRTRIMHINLDLKVGQWRNLTKKEMQVMNQQLKGSKKHFE